MLSLHARIPHRRLAEFVYVPTRLCADKSVRVYNILSCCACALVCECVARRGQPYNNGGAKWGLRPRS